MSGVGGRAGLAAVAALLALGAGCSEDLVAPGRCPELCPSSRVQVVDTTYTGVVTADSTFRGYVSASASTFLLLSDLPGLQSLALVRLASRDTAWIPSITDTLLTIGRYDSVRVQVNVVGRDTTVRNVRILLYRLPFATDTASDYAALLPYLADSLLVDSLLVPDSVATGTVVGRVRDGVLERIAPEDNQQVVLLLRVRADAPTALSIGASEDYEGATRVAWYVHAKEPRDTVSHVFQAGAEFDTFSHTPATTVPAGAVAAGGIPAARAVVRFALPAPALDSVGLVRATLILTPLQRVRGRPGEAFRLSARGLLRDYGAKSIVFADSSAGGTAPLAVGDSGEIHIEVSRLLRVWSTAAGDSLPRSLMLLTTSEGLGMGEVVLAGHGAGALAPRLRLTYVRPYVFGVP